MTTQQYNAYKMVGENHVGAHQIAALYEGCIKFLYQAKDAIDAKDYETRFNTVNKVSNIIVGLRECLNFDEAGDVAKVLDDYYAMIDFQLLTLQSNDSAELCDQIITSLKQMHGAWNDVAVDYNKNQSLAGDETLSLSEHAESAISRQNNTVISASDDEDVDADITKALSATMSSSTYSSRGIIAGVYAQQRASAHKEADVSHHDSAPITQSNTLDINDLNV